MAVSKFGNFGGGDAFKKAPSLPVGALIQIRKAPFAAASDGEDCLARIAGRDFALDQAVIFKFSENAAQVTWVEHKFSRNFTRRDFSLCDQFVEHPGLSQRIFAVQQVFLQRSGFTGIEPVETSKGSDVVFGDPRGQ